MNVNRALGRLVTLVAAIFFAASLASAPASASPNDLDSGNKWLVAQYYAAVVNKAFADGGLRAPTLFYAAHEDVSAAEKSYGGAFVIDVDKVYADRQRALFAPAFRLGVQIREFIHDQELDPQLKAAHKINLPLNQAYVGGAFVKELAETTGLSIVPDQDAAINSLIRELASSYKGVEDPYGDLRESYERGLTIGLAREA